MALSNSKFSRSVISCFVYGLVTALFFCGQDACAQTWGRLYHGPWTEWYTGSTFYDTLATSDGGYLLTGTSNGRGIILKVSSEGTLQWSKLVKGFGYQKDSYMITAVEAPNGDFVVAGQVFLNSTDNPGAGVDGSWDIYMIRLTSSGSISWQKVYSRKNGGEHPDTTEAPQFIYKSCTADLSSCNFVVTGYVVYSHVGDCSYHGYRASQALIVNDLGVVQNDFLMAGPSTPGDGAVTTFYTSDGNYLVLTELWYGSLSLYSAGLQKYGPTGTQLWTKGYFEAFHKPDGDHLLGISVEQRAGIAETTDGYVVAGNTYYSYSGDTSYSSYYHFRVDKATGAAVAWNKKYKISDWSSLWETYLETSPDGSLVAKIEDGSTAANDRIIKTSQADGSLLWANEYAGTLSSLAPGSGQLMVTTSAFDALLGKLNPNGALDLSCQSLPISSVGAQLIDTSILRTDVYGGHLPSGCNSGISRVTAYVVDFIEPGEYHEAGQCAASPTATPTVAPTNTPAVKCYSLKRRISPPRGGSIRVSPAYNCAGKKYLSNTSVRLTAVVARKYRFVKWSGAVKGKKNKVALKMTGNKTVTAIFKRK